MPKLAIPHMDDCRLDSPCLACRIITYVGSDRSAEQIEDLADALRQTVAIPSETDLHERVERLQLPARTTKVLRDAGLITVGAIICKTPADMFKVAGFGRKSYEAVQEALAKRQLHFR